MLELARDAHEVREIEVAEPQGVDAGHGGNRIDVGEPLDRFDLRDHQRALVQRRDLLRDVAALIVVVREAERRAAPPGRRIARARHDVRRFLGGADHRHHHAQRADVERAGDEVILAARHAHHRHDVEPATERHLRLERLEREPGVLHVVEHELGAGVAADLRDARREELEDHRAVGAAAGGEGCFDGIGAHGPDRCA